MSLLESQWDLHSVNNTFSIIQNFKCALGIYDIIYSLQISMKYRITILEVIKFYVFDPKIIFRSEDYFPIRTFYSTGFPEKYFPDRFFGIPKILGDSEKINLSGNPTSDVL